MNLRPKFRARPSWKPKPRPRSFFKRKENNLCNTNLAAKGRQKRVLIKGRITRVAAVAQRKSDRRLNHIGKHWLSKPAVVIRGQREICNPATDEGRAEYKWRTLLMWVRQNGWCCFHEYDFCPGRLKLRDATFEHEDKRTRGQQDDRISYFDEAGKEHNLNGAAHGECNRIAGSRKLPIDHGTNCSYQEDNHAA